MSDTVQWFCPDCGIKCESKFCPNCGKVKPEVVQERPAVAPEQPAAAQAASAQPTAQERPVVAPQTEAGRQPAAQERPTVAQQGQPVAAQKKQKQPKQKKSGGKSGGKAIIIAIVAVVIIAAAAVVMYMFLFSDSYKKNVYDASSVETVVNGKDVYSDKAQDIAFKYTPGLEVSSEDAGVYIFYEDKDDIPYILITRITGSTGPKKYFDQYKKLLKSTYDEVEYGDIEMSEIGDKTVYRLCAKAKSGKDTLYVNRYIEIYGDYSIVYTSVTYDKTGLEGEIYNLIDGLYPSRNAYKNAEINVGATSAPSQSGTTSSGSASSGDMTMKQYAAGTANFTIELPSVLPVDVSEYNVYGMNEHMLATAAYQNSVGNMAIYNAYEFAMNIVSYDGYLAAFFGLDSVALSGGYQTTVNGYDYFCYTVDVADDEDFRGTGLICITDAAPIGFYMMMYAVDDDADEQWRQAGENLLSTFKPAGPKISNYTVVDYLSQYGWRMIYNADKIPVAGLIDEAGIYEFRMAADQAGNIRVFRDALGIDDMRDMYFTSLKNSLGVEPQISDYYTLSIGRYNFIYCEAVYDGGNGVSVACDMFMYEYGGYTYAITYVEYVGNTDWADALVNDLMWSFEIQP